LANNLELIPYFQKVRQEKDWQNLASVVDPVLFYPLDPESGIQDPGWIIYCATKTCSWNHKEQGKRYPVPVV
jgi:hypothetical protein